MASFPPANYIPTESKNTGIALYKPRPEKVKHQEIILHKCASCGGDMAFDAGLQDLKCTMCGKGHSACPQCHGGMRYDKAQGLLVCDACDHTMSRRNDAVGTSARSEEFRAKFLEEAAQGWGTERKEIECQVCNAQVIVDPDVLTTECSWCGSTKIVQQKKPHDVMRPRFLLPFSIERDHCRTITTEWMGNSWVLPKTLREVAAVEEYKSMFIPYWTFDAAAAAQWQAEVGHEKKVYKDGEWKTEIVWKQEGGNARNQFNNVLVSGTERLKSSWLDNIGRFDLSNLTPYQPKYLAGSQALAYDTKIRDSWSVARQQMRDVVLAQCKEGPSTNRVRNFRMELHFDQEKWRYILVPIYVANYFYNNEAYQLVINGQTGAIAGKRPIDWRKILTASGIPFALGLLLQLILLLVGASDLSGVAWLLMGVGVIALLVLSIIAQGVKDG